MGTGTVVGATRPLGLSAREAQIMTLIAAGHSNGQIAASLVLAGEDSEESREPDLRQARRRLPVGGDLPVGRRRLARRQRPRG